MKSTKYNRVQYVYNVHCTITVYTYLEFRVSQSMPPKQNIIFKKDY